MIKCSRCKEDLTDFRIEIKLNFRTDRKKNEGGWEKLPNLDLRTSEILCQDCFNKLAELYSQMNIKYS